MGQEIVYCSRCQTRLTGGDFDKGSAVRIANYVCCFTCLSPEEKAGLEKIVKSPASPSGSRLPPITPRAFPAASAAPRGAKAGEPGRKPSPIVLAAAGIGVVVLIVIVLVVALRPSPPAPQASTPPAPASVHLEPPPSPAAKDHRAELDAIQAELAGPLSQNNFRFAHAILERSRTRHADAAWTQALEAFDRTLGDRLRARFNDLRNAAAQAAERKNHEAVRDARAEISGWGPAFATPLKEFEEEFAAALAASPSPGEPVKPAPDPVPVKPPAPARTEAETRSLAAWKKAMDAAARRDYDRAAADLRAAGQGLTEEKLRKELDADLKDLERLPALRAEAVKAAASLSSWEDVVLDVLQEDGSRNRIRGLIYRAGPRRLELRNEPRFVEIDGLSAGSLARILVRKKGKPSEDDARALALLCALDSDAAAAAEFAPGGATGLSAKVRDLAGEPRAADPDPAKKKEWAARRLFYEAEKDFRLLESRGAALEKFDRLLGSFADTEFVRLSRQDVAARIEETRDNVFGAGRMTGKGVFSAQKVAVALGKEKAEMSGWRAREEPAGDDPNNYVEVTFFAPAGVEYKAWALIGGCCAATFTWYLQANELTCLDKKTRKPLACDPGGNFAAPWEHHVKSLSSTHGGKNHAKAEKEPVLWDWAEISLPKFSLAGPKTIRLLSGSKGQAVAALIVSANREKRPGAEEMRKIAEIPADEAVDTSALRIGKGEPDLLAQIPEARPYQLVYDLDLAKVKKPVKYDVDRRAEVARPFDRIGYALELQKSGGPMTYVFVTMDAFAEDAGKIGIPDVASGARFQQKVGSMNVHSNVEGVINGINLDGGNIEFWPNNYGPYNGAKVPGATNDKYDFGDQFSDPVDGYGCMQVHNHKASQTVFAINLWSAGNGAELGIGNSPTGNPDYTFTKNGTSYSYKRLRVLVRPKADGGSK